MLIQQNHTLQHYHTSWLIPERLLALRVPSTLKVLRLTVWSIASTLKVPLSKTLRSTLALLPLFGLGIIFQFYPFSDDPFSLASHIQQFLVILIQNTQVSYYIHTYYIHVITYYI